MGEKKIEKQPLWPSKKYKKKSGKKRDNNLQIKKKKS